MVSFCLLLAKCEHFQAEVLIDLLGAHLVLIYLRADILTCQSRVLTGVIDNIDEGYIPLG